MLTLTAPTSCPVATFEGRWDDPEDFAAALFYGSEDAPSPDASVPDWFDLTGDLFASERAPFLTWPAADGGVYVFGTGEVVDVDLLMVHGDHVPAAVAQGAPLWAWADPCRGSLADEEVQAAREAILAD